MKRRGLKLRRGHRWSIYSVGLALLISGFAWARLHHLDEGGIAGDPWREFKPWLMKVHGFAALGFVLLLGTLLPVHVRHSWHARRNRANGTFFLSSVGILTLTGYALYYLGDEKLRALCSDVHFWLGAGIPLLLIWHIRSRSVHFLWRMGTRPKCNTSQSGPANKTMAIRRSHVHSR